MGVGALFLAANVAPTEEMVLIAQKMGDASVVVLSIVSLACMHAFVFAVEFRGKVTLPPDTPFWSAFLSSSSRRCNGGDATYADLEVEGTLRGTSGREERATATLDYLHGRSSREAGLFFTSDPARGTLDLSPKGFRRP